MDPPAKRIKLTTELRRSVRLQNQREKVKEVPNQSQIDLTSNEISYTNILNFITENKLIPKYIKTENVKKTRRFLEKLLNTTFSSKSNLEEGLLMDVRDVLKERCGLSNIEFSPVVPLTTCLPSSSPETQQQQQHLMTAAASTSDDTAASTSDDTAASTFDYTAALTSDDTAASTSDDTESKVLFKNTRLQSVYERAIINFILDVYEERTGIHNFMINCKDLTTTLKTELSKRFNSNGINWNSQIIDQPLPDLSRKILLYDLEDHEISDAEYKILEKCRLSGYDILILDALPIYGRSYQIIEYVSLTANMTRSISLDEKTKFLLSGDTHYHFDLLYNIDILVPQTEIEFHFIRVLLTENTYNFKTLTAVLRNKDEICPLKNYILKLYSHNLIVWSCSHITFASKSIRNKYAKCVNSTKPNQFHYFLNCVTAAIKLSNMTEANIEILSFDFLSKLNVYVEYLVKKKVIVNEATLNAELYRIFRNVPNGAKVQVQVLDLCYHYSLCAKAKEKNQEKNSSVSPPAPQPAPLPSELMDKPVHLLKELLASDFICAMLYSAKHDNKDLYMDIVKKCQEIEKEQQKSNIKCSIPIDDSIKKLCNLEIENVVSNYVKVDTEPITYCLQPLLAVQNLVNPSTDTSTYISQLHMIQRLKNYSNARLYCEVIRACMLCLHDVTGTIKESHWGGFTVLKLPQILKDLHASTLQNENENFEYSQDVIDAFELLLRYTPLLDKMDIICAGNSVEVLLNEFQKVNLVTEKHAKQISSRRAGLLTSLQKFDTQSINSSIRSVIIRAEPTLAGFLKTLNAEYTKIPDALLSMLCQVLTGNSFELMLAVATVEGKMKTFVSRLIKCNECSKQINEVPGKTATTRALLFEISFLMLCSIVQTYGPDIVLEEGGDSFFEQWVRECMPLKDKPKSPYKMLQNVDPAKVDLLLAQINSVEPDLKSSNTKWHVSCQSAMGVAKELVFAWESGTLSNADAKRALNGLRATSCCLPVCAAAWLCAYTNITHHDALLKPINMLQQFLNPIPSDEIMQDNFKERSSLMFQIIRKMLYEIHPPTQSKTKVLSVSHSIISKFPILEQLQQVWQEIYQRGWINIQATQSLESLLRTGGPLWFVTNLVKELLKIQYQEELDRSLDLIFAIFHLDIENCTLDLINHVLPQYLYNSLQGKKLVEPQASTLAKLCVYCIFSTLEYHNNNPQLVNSRKRTRKDMDPDDMDLGMPAAKILRLNEASDSNSIFGSSSPQAQGTTNGQKSVVLREPLLSALNGLFTNFNFLAGRNGEVSQHTHFILQFLQLTVQCGKDRARVILQKMPQTLVPSLLKALPECFTTDLLLRLYDVQTILGRKAIARDLCMLRNIQLKPTK